MKNANQLISIIIPTYNEEGNIAKCLSTLLEQSYENKEIIVVDDGSDDRTPEIVKNYSVKLIRQSHQGPAVARNKAAGEALGDVLVFVDADMSFSKDFIKELTNPIREGEAMGTFSKEEYISNWENVWSRCWNINQNWPQQKMIPDDYPDEGNDYRAILKRDFLEVGGFDNIGYTDTWTLAKKLGIRPKAVKGAKYYHSNPSTLREVFIQSKWVSKRPYKLWILGKIYALFRQSIPVSLLIGLYKSVKYNEPRFIIFKIFYDLGGFIGILESTLGGKLYK